MKKFAVFILALFYLGISSGAPVNIHYCMGEYAGWDLGHSDDEDQCNSCGMDKDATADKNKCCTDEKKVLKIDDVHKSAQVYVDLLQVMAVSSSANVSYHPDAPPSASTVVHPLPNAPPNSTSQQTFIFIRSIRI